MPTTDTVSPTEAAVAVHLAADVCADPASPWYGCQVVQAHVGDGTYSGPFGGYVDLQEALTIINRDSVVNTWDPDTGCLRSAAPAIDGFHWTFPTTTRPT